MARDLLHYAKLNNVLQKEQHESSHGNEASSRAVNKKLLHGMVHLLRKLLVLYSDDSKSCYDWIAHPVASLAMKHMVMPLAPM